MIKYTRKLLLSISFILFLAFDIKLSTNPGFATLLLRLFDVLFILSILSILILLSNRNKEKEMENRTMNQGMNNYINHYSYTLLVSPSMIAIATLV